MSGDGKRPPGPRRSLDASVEAAAEDFEEHGHTLSAMQGRRLRNELSGMALRGVDGFEGEDALGADEGVSPGSTPVTTPGTTPSTTLTGDEQVALSRAIAADPFAPRGAAVATRRESMPPSSGHARLSATLFAPSQRSTDGSAARSPRVVSAEDPGPESESEAAARLLVLFFHWRRCHGIAL